MHFKYENKVSHRMVKQLLNSIIGQNIVQYLSVSHTSISPSLRFQQVIDLLATDRSRYFPQIYPIIVNYPRYTSVFSS